MCLPQEFTAGNIAAKVRAIPRAELYLSQVSLPSLPGGAPITPLVTKATCCDGTAAPQPKSGKNSLIFVLNSYEGGEGKKREPNRNGRVNNCLVQISVLGDPKFIECTFTCLRTNRYARLTFHAHNFLLNRDAKRGLVSCLFGEIVSPAFPPPLQLPSSPVAVSIPINNFTHNSIATPSAQRIAPAPTTPITPMTREQKNKEARREKEELRKIRKREAAARSNKRRSEERKKAARPSGR